MLREDVHECFLLFLMNETSFIFLNTAAAEYAVERPSRYYPQYVVRTFTVAPLNTISGFKKLIMSMQATVANVFPTNKSQFLFFEYKSSFIIKIIFYQFIFKAVL